MKRLIFAGLSLAIYLHAQTGIAISPVPGTCGEPHSCQYRIEIPIPQDGLTLAVKFTVSAVLVDGTPVSVTGAIPIPQIPYPPGAAGAGSRPEFLSATFSLGGIVGGAAVDQFVVQTVNLSELSQAIVGVALSGGSLEYRR